MTDKRNLYKGIALMLSSAALACTGQLLWKIAAQRNSIILVIAGFVLYGSGALVMIIAMRYGELSVLHPLMSAGYVLSLFLGAIVLHEQITPMKIIGVAVIILGMVFVCSSGREIQK